MSETPTLPSQLKNCPVYQAKHGLVFSGSLPDLAISKCYHALLFIAQLKGWEPNAQRYFTITIAELDRITGGSCHKWNDYVDLLDWVRRNVTIDWALFNRSGKYDSVEGRPVGQMPILWDIHGLEDLETKKINALEYRFPDAILDHFLETKGWFGQVDPVVLFRFRNHAGFNAYLYACMVSTGKSETNEFWSSSYSKAEWRGMLGIEDGKYTDANFTNVLMPRLAKQISEKTEGTRKPMMVEFRKTKDKRFQMRVVVLSNALLPDETVNEFGLTKTEEADFWAYMKRELAIGESLPDEPDYSRFEKDWYKRAICEWRPIYDRRFIWDMDAETRRRFYLFLVRTDHISFGFDETDKQGWLDMDLDALKNKYDYWLLHINQTTKQPKKKRTKEPSN